VTLRSGTPALRRSWPAWPAADGVEVSASAASPLAALGPGSLAGYWRFQRAVAKAQLAAWLPASSRLLIDISGRYASGSAQAAAHGHTVIRVVPAVPARRRAGGASAGGASAGGASAGGASAGAPDGAGGTGAAGRAGAAGTGGAGGRAGAVAGAGVPGGTGKVVPVVGDPASLAFLADGCADGVIAEDGALSRQLMTEDLAAEIARVLRPGGELLACVDSLVLGMAILAEQHRWAHLTDLPHAEVVLIPWPDGTITRCFGAGQFRDLLTEAGLEVSWIKPRTVLSPSMVDHVLRHDPGSIARLVRAELAAGQEGSPGHLPAESFGISLLAAACKPPGPVS
jgi:hypothetical protein